MPHVFTLEGASFGEPISFPPAGSPLAPHQAIIGPTRVATPVYGPGGTPQMYRQRYPDRGPVCDYCDPAQFAVMSSSQMVIPFQQDQFGDVDTFLRKQNPIAAALMVIGGSLAAGAALGGFGILLYKGMRRRQAATW